MKIKNNKRFFRLIAILIGCSIALLSLEIVLRFLPVTGPIPYADEFNASNPIKRLQPNMTFTWSRGWNFSQVNQVHVNNYGFFNQQDYQREHISPLLAVIGDSYVESMMVPYEETTQGRLAKIVENRGRVYSFAFSGDPLSQYLKHAEYAKSEFNADGMVFVIIANDFDESLYKYRKASWGYFFKEDSQGNLYLDLVELSGKYRLVSHAPAVLRYFQYDLGGIEAVRQFFNRLTSDKTYVANVDADVSDERLRDSKRAVDAFFNELPFRTGLPNNKVLFVLDGIRQTVYQPETKAVNQASYAYRMNQYFMDKAKSLGYEVIDMQDVFEKDYTVNNQKFEFPTDWHWNGYGHEAASKAIASSRVFHSVYP